MTEDEARYCDAGCGYRLPEEYDPDETTCGACLDGVRPIATLWLIDRAESLLEASEVGIIGEASRSALVEEARRDVERAADQIDAAVEVLASIGRRLLVETEDWSWKDDLLFAIDLLVDDRLGFTDRGRLEVER